MKSRVVLALLLIGLVASGVYTIVGSKTGTQSGKEFYQAPQQQKLVTDEATPVIEGVLTEKQKAHSQVFSKQYEWYRRGERLRDLPGTGDAGFVIGVPNGMVNMGSYHTFVQRLVCDADAVITATVTSKSSQLTTDGTFVFTDYEMTVTDVPKNNVAAGIQDGSKVTITRPGGTILLNARRVQVTDSSFETFKVNRHYLLFLKYIPLTGAYMALNSKAAFEIQNEKVVKLTKEPLIPELEGATDAGSLIAEVPAGSSSGCGR
jgi:hypothetical protein